MEDGIVWNQTGNTSCPGDPNYVHNHLVRDMMNGALGEEIINGTWNTNDVITKTVNHIVPTPTGSAPDMVWDSCHVVVLAYKVGSPLSTGAEIQQAVEMVLKSPDYVATIASTSPDIIGENNIPGEFTSVIENIGLWMILITLVVHLTDPRIGRENLQRLMVPLHLVKPIQFRLQPVDSTDNYS